VAGTLADVAGPGSPRPVITGQFRLGDVRHIVASPALARSWLDFTAAIPFEDGVADLIGDDGPSATPDPTGSARPGSGR